MEIIEELTLLKPTKEYFQEIQKFKEEFDGEFIYGSNGLHEFTELDEWLKDIKNNSHIETVRPGFVTGDQFICVRTSDHKVIGIINVRHELNKYLLQTGGHVGYSVRPSERRKGIAQWMLREILKFYKDRGIEKILVTCDYENVGSRQTILNAGGQFESTVFDENDQVDVERYWINT